MELEIIRILELLSYTIPAIITGFIAYHFFKMHTQNEERRRRHNIKKEAKKNALPIRLQAYERMALFLERINPSQLLIRVKPLTDDKNRYENLVIAQIEQEFEHNLTQQIYISDECWNVILTAKNATIQMIRKANMSERVQSADKLREVILNNLLENQTPSNIALAYIKNEVGQLW